MAAIFRVAEIFADARMLHDQALKRLDAGDIRDAAEKAWGATKRATDASILECTGREPNRTSQTSSGIKALGRRSSEFESLRNRFGNSAYYLHGDCFYEGDCEPEDFIGGLIRATADYIRDAEKLT